MSMSENHISIIFLPFSRREKVPDRADEGRSAARNHKLRTQIIKASTRVTATQEPQPSSVASRHLPPTGEGHRPNAPSPHLQFNSPLQDCHSGESRNPDFHWIQASNPGHADSLDPDFRRDDGFGVECEKTKVTSPHSFPWTVMQLIGERKALCYHQISHFPTFGAVPFTRQNIDL